MMKRIAIILWTMLCLANGAWGKPCVKRASFWVGESVILASVTADDLTTAKYTGPNAESNIGNHPSNRQIALFGLLSAGIESGLHLAACHIVHTPDDDKLGWRIFGEAGIPVVTATIYGYFGAYKNSQISQAHEAARNYQLK